MGVGIGFHIDGAPEFKRALEKLVEHKMVDTRAAVASGAHVIEAAAKQHFSGAHPKGSPHVGGSDPNIVSGTLRRSIHVDGPLSAGPMTWEARVGPSTVYARAIELGLRQNRAIKFPYMAPGFRDAMPKVNDIFRAAWSF